MTPARQNALPLAPPYIWAVVADVAHSGVRAAGRARLRGRAMCVGARHAIL
ncbi:hypothetical protein [Roseinatronobacter bogoriensis]|uniref:hypothetical protein n=1 Tax=Roseinatronobacter bogoriensis TaxID=119542 RepID=UPI0018E27EC6|nr:hypothetical protein [Rhodobaca bogoriensis]